MPKITFKIDARARAAEQGRRVQKAAELATGKAAFDIQAHAQIKAPVDTGFLRSSIQANGRGLKWRVDSFADYSLFVEFGTRFMSAQPYFIPAIEHVAPTYMRAMKRILS